MQEREHRVVERRCRWRQECIPRGEKRPAEGGAARILLTELSVGLDGTRGGYAGTRIEYALWEVYSIQTIGRPFTGAAVRASLLL